MMSGGSIFGSNWETLPTPWSGGDDYYDHSQYDDPHTYWGKGNSRITRPGNNHAPGRSDPLGHSTTKSPPYWEPSDERLYPFDMWYTDIENWCVLADLAPEKHASAIGFRLGGTAKDMFRQIPSRTLRDGVRDLTTGLTETGLELLMRELQERYGKLSLETSMHALVQMLKFQRRPW